MPEHRVGSMEPYSSWVPQGSFRIVRALFERICVAIQARRLGWKAHTEGETIGFKATHAG